MPLKITDAMPRKEHCEPTLGERLQILRKARRLAPAQLAEAAQTTQAVSHCDRRIHSLVAARGLRKNGTGTHGADRNGR